MGDFHAARGDHDNRNKTNTGTSFLGKGKRILGVYQWLGVFLWAARFGRRGGGDFP